MDEPRSYDVTVCAAADLNEEDRATCIALIRRGGAVDPEYAETELPRADVVAVARSAGRIVGVGAIKRTRPSQADTAYKSGVALASDTRELGYVAVDLAHRGQRLSQRIVGLLLSKNAGPLFATTSSDRMKRTLAKAGFTRNGCEWEGRRALLSLWIRE